MLRKKQHKKCTSCSAKLVQIKAPSKVYPGQKFNVTIIWKNTGWVKTSESYKNVTKKQRSFDADWFYGKIAVYGNKSTIKFYPPDKKTLSAWEPSKEKECITKGWFGYGCKETGYKEYIKTGEELKITIPLVAPSYEKSDKGYNSYNLEFVIKNPPVLGNKVGDKATKTIKVQPAKPIGAPAGNATGNQTSNNAGSAAPKKPANVTKKSAKEQVEEELDEQKGPDIDKITEECHKKYGATFGVAVYTDKSGAYKCKVMNKYEASKKICTEKNTYWAASLPAKVKKCAQCPSKYLQSDFNVYNSTINLKIPGKCLEDAGVVWTPPKVGACKDNAPKDKKCGADSKDCFAMKTSAGLKCVYKYDFIGQGDGYKGKPLFDATLNTSDVKFKSGIKIKPTGKTLPAYDAVKFTDKYKLLAKNSNKEEVDSNTFFVEMGVVNVGEKEWGNDISSNFEFIGLAPYNPNAVKFMKETGNYFSAKNLLVNYNQATKAGIEIESAGGGKPIINSPIVYFKSKKTDNYAFKFWLSVPKNFSSGKHELQFRLINKISYVKYNNKGFPITPMPSKYSYFGPIFKFEVDVVQPANEYNYELIDVKGLGKQSIVEGAKRTVSITVKNTGWRAWTRDLGIKLGTVGDSSGDAYMFTKTTRPGTIVDSTIPTIAGSADCAQLLSAFKALSKGEAYKLWHGIPWGKFLNGKWSKFKCKKNTFEKAYKDINSGVIKPLQVRYGQQYTFTFDMTAPPITKQQYNLEFNLLKEGSFWFSQPIGGSNPNIKESYWALKALPPIKSKVNEYYDHKAFKGYFAAKAALHADEAIALFDHYYDFFPQNFSTEEMASDPVRKYSNKVWKRVQRINSLGAEDFNQTGPQDIKFDHVWADSFDKAYGAKGWTYKWPDTKKPGSNIFAKHNYEKDLHLAPAKEWENISEIAPQDRTMLQKVMFMDMLHRDGLDFKYDSSRKSEQLDMWLRFDMLKGGDTYKNNAPSFTLFTNKKKEKKVMDALQKEFYDLLEINSDKVKEQVGPGMLGKPGQESRAFSKWFYDFNFKFKPYNTTNKRQMTATPRPPYGEDLHDPALYENTAKGEKFNNPFGSCKNSTVAHSMIPSVYLQDDYSWYGFTVDGNNNIMDASDNWPSRCKMAFETKLTDGFFEGYTHVVHPDTLENAGSAAGSYGFQDHAMTVRLIFDALYKEDETVRRTQTLSKHLTVNYLSMAPLRNFVHIPISEHVEMQAKNWKKNLTKADRSRYYEQERRSSVIYWQLESGETHGEPTSIIDRPTVLEPGGDGTITLGDATREELNYAYDAKIWEQLSEIELGKLKWDYDELTKPGDKNGWTALEKVWAGNVGYKEKTVFWDDNKKSKKHQEFLFRSYNEILNGALAHHEILGYKIVKGHGNSPNGSVRVLGSESKGFKTTFTQTDSPLSQVYVFPRGSEDDAITYIDSQVKYGKGLYHYDIYALVLVYGTRYRYWHDGSPNSMLYKVEDYNGAPALRFRTNVEHEPVFKIFEIPLINMLHSNGAPYDVSLDVDPSLPPVMQILPYRGVNNKLLFMFDKGTGQICRDKTGASINCDLYNKSLGHTKYTGLSPINEYILYRATHQEVLDTNGDIEKALKEKARVNAHLESYIENNINPNVKYYYAARSTNLVDKEKNPSFNSPIYSVEIVDEGGVVFPLIEVVPKHLSKVAPRKMISFKEKIRIKPSFLQSAPNKDKKDLGYRDKVTLQDGTEKSDYSVQEALPCGVKTINNKLEKYQPILPQFKIRVTSQKTGKKIDLNILFRKTDKSNTWKKEDVKMLLSWE